MKPRPTVKERPEQLADAYFVIALVNHYMVGIVDSTVTDDERDAAEQILISRQNALPQIGDPNRQYSLALDLLENDRRTARAR